MAKDDIQKQEALESVRWVWIPDSITSLFWMQANYLTSLGLNFYSIKMELYLAEFL